MVVATLVIAWLAIVFSNSDQAVRIGDGSEALLHADGLLNAAVAARSSVDLALVFATAEESELAAKEATDGIVADGRNLVGEIESSLALLVGVDPALDATVSTATRALVSTVSETLDLVEDRRVDEAERLAQISLNAAFDGLRNVLIPYRDRVAAVVSAERGSVGRVARAAGFGVAFLIPALAILMFRSITRRRQQQTDLIASLENEKALGRARDDMISNLSHELRTPLTAIYGFALAMREEGFGDMRLVADTTDLIIEEAGRLGRMVEDLLVVAKGDSDNLAFQSEEVDIVREIREALTPFEHQDRRPEVVVEPATVLGDRFRLRHIVTNLVANAIDHGGTSIAINGVAKGNWYHCSIVDDGAGVSEAMADKLFSRYVHEGANPLLAGTVGLGLAVAQTLLHQMGGDIRYERLEGLTIFHFRIPLAGSHQPAVPDSLNA
jgi:signal transduction histidine kinase